MEIMIREFFNSFLMNTVIFIPSSFVELIRWMDNYINTTIQNLQHEFTLSAFFIFIIFSFLYGIVHSAGPGHGKTIITVYFLKEKNPIIKAVILSSIVSIIHTGSSIILAFLFATILSGIKGFFRIKLQSYFILASGILIAIIGIFFLLLKVLKKEVHKISNKNIFLIGFSAGIIPCPVALVIMLFSISNNIISIGLISVLSISLGMFSLLILIGIVGIKLRSALLYISNKYFNKVEKISEILEYISILLIIFIGSFMSLNIIIK